MPKKNKKPQKTTPVKATDPVFSYTSVCHNVQAVKTPVVMPQGRRISQLGGAPDSDGQVTGLGKFRCGECKKPCKVLRTRNQKKQDTNV